MPAKEQIVDLAMAENHDADIPTNIGSLPPQHVAPAHPSQAQTLAMSRRSSSLFGSDPHDKDIEEKDPVTDESAKLKQLGYYAEASSDADSPTDEERGRSGSGGNEDEDPNLVFWDGEDDPQNPKNWSKGRKWASIALVSMITFLTPLGSSSLAPGVPQVMSDFGNDSELLSGFVVSVYVLGFAVGPLVIAPLSEMYGRLPLYHSCGITFAIFNCACALAANLNQLIVFRFFAGCFGAAPLALGGGTIADIAHADNRATAMALWTLGPTVGPVLGPVAGSFICKYLGWRWNFWIIAIAAGVVMIFGMLLMRETYAPTLLERKARKLRKETGNPALRSKLDAGLSTKDLFLYSIVRPSKMLIFSPVVFSQSLYVAIVYAYLYLMFTTVTTVFQHQYHFRDDIVGLAFVGMGLGSFLGQFGYTWAENRNYAYHKAKGDLRPEHRLIAMVPGSIILPIGLFWYAWSVEARVHWICPMFAMGFFGFGLLLIFMSAANYLVDCFTVHAASAMAANCVLRSLFAAVLPLAGPSMYAKLGYGWGASVLGFIALTCIPIPFFFLKYGEWLRTDPRFQVKL